MQNNYYSRKSILSIYKYSIAISFFLVFFASSIFSYVVLSGNVELFGDFGFPGIVTESCGIVGYALFSSMRLVFLVPAVIAVVVALPTILISCALANVADRNFIIVTNLIFLLPMLTILFPSATHSVDRLVMRACSSELFAYISLYNLPIIFIAFVIVFGNVNLFIWSRKVGAQDNG